MHAKVPSKANAGGSGPGIRQGTGSYCYHALHGIRMRAGGYEWGAGAGFSEKQAEDRDVPAIRLRLSHNPATHLCTFFNLP